MAQAADLIPPPPSLYLWCLFNKQDQGSREKETLNVSMAAPAINKTRFGKRIS
jgi:hypothetical protein